MRRPSLRVHGRNQAASARTPPSGLRVIADDEGSVSFGFVTDGVLYARFEEGLSAGVGAEYARALEDLVARVSTLQYFADASALRYYDLLARSAFVRVVLANRRKFASLVMLTWAGGFNRAVRVFADTLGGPHILVDKAEFERLLFKAAPGAHRVLGIDSSQWRLRER